jgi:hypothetical protein
MGGVAIPVRRALPGADGRQVGRLQGGDLPLVHRVVGDPAQPDLSVTPVLYAGPLDALVEVSRLSCRQGVDDAGRAPGATGVDPHDRIPVRHPLLRVGHLPGLVQVRGAGRDVGVLLDHAFPCARISLAEL